VFKKKLGDFFYEVAKDRSEGKFLFFSLCWSLNLRNFQVFSHEFKTRKHFTVIFTIYLSPENGTYHLMFLMSFRSGRNTAKVTCVCFKFFFLNSRGKFYTSLYYFLVASGTKGILLKCPLLLLMLLMILVEVAVLKKCFS